MRREEAIAVLRGHLPAVRRDFGVRRIALFGSAARGEARDDSDLDVLVEFENDPTFLSFMGLKAFLEDQLGRKVDLVTPDALKPRMRPIVEREAVDHPRLSATGVCTPTTSSRRAARSGASLPG
jgi:predicted nucleotidyltransferase